MEFFNRRYDLVIACNRRGRYSVFWLCRFLFVCCEWIGRILEVEVFVVVDLFIASDCCGWYNLCRLLGLPFVCCLSGTPLPVPLPEPLAPLSECISKISHFYCDCFKYFSSWCGCNCASSEKSNNWMHAFLTLSNIYPF
jgi:hypothetical protein